MAMIVGIGLDLVEVPRLTRALTNRGERLEKRIYTDRERADCERRADRIQALAARFAAKEACLKALGTGWAEGLSFRQVEIVRAQGGRPEIRLHGRASERATQLGVGTIHVTLTHEPGIAAAVVVLES